MEEGGGISSGQVGRELKGDGVCDGDREGSRRREQSGGSNGWDVYWLCEFLFGQISSTWDGWGVRATLSGTSAGILASI